MDIFSKILDIQGYKVANIETSKTEVHIYLDSESKNCICPRCGRKNNQVRQSYGRVVRDLPVSGKACYLHFTKRYFDCSNCKDTFSEPLEFVESKRDYTSRYEKSIFKHVRHSDASFVAESENLTDKVVTRIFIRQAQKVLPKEPFKNVVRLGIDEIAERKGKNSYDLVFYDLDAGNPIEVLESRTKAQLMNYLEDLPDQIKAQIEEVCIDMWRPYADAIAEKLPDARLVTDRFHVMKIVNQELKKLKNKVKKHLPEKAKACHYPLLKNEDDLTENQKEILENVYEASPILKRAHELKEQFRDIFDKEQTVQQGKNQLNQWIIKAEKANLFADAIKTIKNWIESIVNYFKQRTTNGPAEGVNNKIKLIKRMAYGFRNFANFRLRILAAFL